MMIGEHAIRTGVTVWGLEDARWVGGGEGPSAQAERKERESSFWGQGGGRRGGRDRSVEKMLKGEHKVRKRDDVTEQEGDERDQRECKTIEGCEIRDERQLEFDVMHGAVRKGRD